MRDNEIQRMRAESIAEKILREHIAQMPMEWHAMFLHFASACRPLMIEAALRGLNADEEDSK